MRQYVHGIPVGRLRTSLASAGMCRPQYVCQTAGKHPSSGVSAKCATRSDSRTVPGCNRTTIELLKRTSALLPVPVLGVTDRSRYRHAASPAILRTWIVRGGATAALA